MYVTNFNTEIILKALFYKCNWLECPFEYATVVGPPETIYTYVGPFTRFSSVLVINVPISLFSPLLSSPPLQAHICRKWRLKHQAGTDFPTFYTPIVSTSTSRSHLSQCLYIKFHPIYNLFISILTFLYYSTLELHVSH